MRSEGLMTIDSRGGKRSLDEDKGVEDGILGERQIALQVRDVNVNAFNEDEKDSRASNELQGPGIVQMHQHQGPVMYWERFLHVTSIRVLLVETDDSTRHIVTALLRNCNYEVLEAGNGLDAWKILEDLTQHIDLVLTEVVMPFVSGIALLHNIMKHKTRKTIPVIMMSSHDSMGLVFNCLSKGAVDFLVKPIRKNELKNLWQHIWRRCHSSSGSGSDSGTRTLKSEKSKESLKSDRSAREEKNGSNGLNVGDGSDDGSGAQSSWTKQCVEVDSSQAMSPFYQIAECPDSNGAQVIRSNAETSGMIVAREGHAQNLPDTVAKGKDLKIAHRNVKLESEKPMEISTQIGGKLKYLDTDCNMTRKHLFREDKDGRYIMSNTPIDVKQSGYSTEVSINDNSTDDSGEPNFEPSLKRLREAQSTGKCVRDDHNVFRHSEQSAFSRYNTSSNTGSSAMTGHSVEIAKRPSVGDKRAHSTGHLVHQNAVGNFPKMDMDSTHNKLPSDPSFSKDNTDLRSTLNSSYPDDMQTTELDPARNPLNYHFAYLEQKPASNHDESSLKKVYADASLSGTTDTKGGNMDDDRPKNCTLNGSASGCNHGSSGQKGSNNLIIAAGNNAETGFGQSGKSESGDGSGTRVNENKTDHREAVLNKFRQKRMGRCFKKKIRYHNRNKLAEQRPRVRGQFVKQAGADSSNRITKE